MNWIDRYFGITAKGSSIRTEVLAGISTFLALSYIFIVNPAILSQAGMDKGAVLLATVLTSGLATLAMGLWAKLPFALAPGMEMNAYVAYFVVGTLGFTWQQALGAVFWSGVLFVILTVSHVRERIIEAIPEAMRSSLSFSVAVFLVLVALKISGIIEYQGIRFHRLGQLTSPVALVFYISVASTLLLHKLHVPGAVIVSIILASVYCHATSTAIETLSSPLPRFRFGGLPEPGIIFQAKSVSVILILFLIDFYGSVAKLLGLTTTTNILIHNRLPRLREALLIDSVGTTFGSVLGTSSITVFVESGVGIGLGGRSGLTAVVCSLLMLACIVVAPLLSLIPVVATTGALVLVAICLCPNLAQLRSMSSVHFVSLALMSITVIATFALDKAMLVGFVPYLYDDFQKGTPNLYRLGSASLLATGCVVQAIA